MKKILITLLLIVTLASCDPAEILDNSPLDTIANVTQTDTGISWDASMVENVTYHIIINDLTTDTDAVNEHITDNYHNFTFEVNKLYKVTVRQYVNRQTSIESEELIIDTFTQEETMVQTYNTNSTHGVSVYLPTYNNVYFIKVNDDFLNTDNYTFENDILYIEHPSLTDTSNTKFYVYTEQGYFLINIQKEDLTLPYMKSENTIIFDETDLYFFFELSGGEFIELSGSDITVEDYTQDHDTLIINASFIQSLFDAKPERSAVILSYQLKNNDEIVIGYLFINRETPNE